MSFNNEVKGISNIHQNLSHTLRDTLQPYYQQGNVFQRQQGYYDQLLKHSAKDRTRDKFPYPKIQSKNESSLLQPSDQLKHLRQENRVLKDQLQKINGLDGQFGSSDQVVKKSHYGNSTTEAKTIISQQSEITILKEQIRKNNEKIQIYGKAANQLDVRIGNIQSIDKQIYKNLKNGTQRDHQLLQKACNALAMNQPREVVANILKKIIEC